jgi:uncharacterized protein YpiB (UPF0302 family)
MQITDITFKPGEWVQIIDHRLKHCTGFILKYDALDENYRMMVTRDSNGKPLREKITIEEDQLLPTRIFKDEDDLFALIDLALDLNDKEWFMELTEKLPLANF